MNCIKDGFKSLEFGAITRVTRKYDETFERCSKLFQRKFIRISEEAWNATDLSYEQRQELSIIAKTDADNVRRNRELLNKDGLENYAFARECVDYLAPFSVPFLFGDYSPPQQLAIGTLAFALIFGWRFHSYRAIEKNIAGMNQSIRDLESELGDNISAKNV